MDIAYEIFRYSISIIIILGMGGTWIMLVLMLHKEMGEVIADCRKGIKHEVQ